jgi:uncharacterized membrane protein
MLALFGVVFFLAICIIPWINLCNIRDLRNKNSELQRTIDQIAELLEANKITVQKPNPPKQNSSDRSQEQYATKTAPSPQITLLEPIKEVINKKEIPQEKKKKSKISFEKQLGERLPVWIGGLALALSGFFLVKYSIEHSLIKPSIRIVIGAIFGIFLLYLAKLVRIRPNFANGTRICQSLAGAGVAVLYLVSYASVNLYHLIPSFIGFVAMAMVTIAALVLSLRHGPAIALMGMVGGFLTPALLSGGGDPNVLTLFSYIYFTAAGILIVAKKTKWWWLSIPTIIISFLWVIFWLFFCYKLGDGIWLILFLIAISTTVIIISSQQYSSDIKDADDINNDDHSITMVQLFNYIGLVGAVIISGIIAEKTGYGFFEWGLFGLISIAGVGLAYFNTKLYGFVPIVSMAVNLVMLLSHNAQDHASFAVVLMIFATIYVASSYLILWKSKTPVLWSFILAAASMLYYLLAYYKLYNIKGFVNIPFQWGIAALILACLSICVIIKGHKIIPKGNYKDCFYSIFITTTTTFISLALIIELDKEFLSVAFAIQMLVVAAINNKVTIKILRLITIIIAGIFMLLILPQIIMMLMLIIHSLTEVKLSLNATLPIIQWPIFQLGLPAIMFYLSSTLLRKQKDDKLVRAFEVFSIILFATMLYYLARNIINPDQNVLLITPSFAERGILTNVLFLYGLLSFWIGRKINRKSFSKCGIVFCFGAMFRVLYLDILLYNPLWTSYQISNIIIFNELLITYGLTLIWGYLAHKEFRHINGPKLISYTGAYLLITLFTLITLNIRQFFHPNSLSETISASNAEIYSYSVAWLLLGIGLLFGGVIKKNKILRYASLVIILLAVGKVFLYDTSGLQGLYRIFSFLGLGFSLIGLSYFYSRFVKE